jgi:hypothetical protein|tara:strand:- start:719 stop:937 length:219 start_codon:yes stop_codon:yes gene_type:complete
MDRSSIGQSKSLQRGQVKLLEQVMKLSKDVNDIKEMILIKWKMEDERYGEYRWPYDQDGDILPNVDMSGRLN